jgi:hypothetical protein
LPGDPASLLQAAVFARINYSLIIIFRISQSPSKGAIKPQEEILRPLQLFLLICFEAFHQSMKKAAALLTLLLILSRSNPKFTAI